MRLSRGKGVSGLGKLKKFRAEVHAIFNRTLMNKQHVGNEIGPRQSKSQAVRCC
jgi:hypothetical protein